MKLAWEVYLDSKMFFKQYIFFYDTLPDPMDFLAEELRYNIDIVVVYYLEGTLHFTLA